MGLRGPQVGTKFKKTLEKEALRQVVYAFVSENMQSVLQGLLERAEGVQVQKKDNKGDDIVYSIPPDPTAAKILMEQAIGKPKESLEHSGKDGGPIELSWLE